MLPITIKVKEGKFLFVEWDDKTTNAIKLKNLRHFCPCASCKSDREQYSKSYIPIFNDDQVTLSDIEVIGHYAVKIIWKDGHAAGIYEFGFLKQLSDKNQK
ncbi:MAG: hypothetical protein A2V66_06270 [Ignavibacteria bacterium RBG_13_36_8]|nr:MAG: hypothetical protein A2V66_06270 [Ignavibacteria bacterium RBG_13_36_8]